MEKWLPGPSNENWNALELRDSKTLGSYHTGG